MAVMNFIEDMPNSGPETSGDDLIGLGTTGEPVFDRWKNCVEITLGSDRGRLDLITEAQVAITKKLVKDFKPDIFDQRLEELHKIHRHSISEDHADPDIFEAYRKLLTEVLEQHRYDLIEHVMSTVLSLCDCFVEFSEGEYLAFIAGERRDLLAAGLSVVLYSIGDIAKSDAGEKPLRRTSENAVNKIESLLHDFLDRLSNSDSESVNAEAVKQNLLTEVRDSLIDSATVVYPEDELVATNLVRMAIEISVQLGESPDILIDELNGNVGSSDLDLLISRVHTNYSNPEYFDVEEDLLDEFLAGFRI